MDLQGQRLLVTGGSGMLGSHVVDLLIRAGAERVICVDTSMQSANLAEAIGTGRVDLAEVDIRDAARMQDLVLQVDTVIHLAALLLLSSRQQPRDSFDVNLSATYDLLGLCSKYRRRLVFGSTVGVYGQPEEDRLITEDSPIGARTFYGASKFGGELYCRAFADFADLNYVSLRLGTLYGDRLHRSGFYPQHLLSMLERCDAGVPIELPGDPGEVHDFLYVGDAADAVVRAVIRDEVRDVAINVVSGTPVTLSQIFHTLLKVNGAPQEIKWLPREVQFATRRRFSRARAEQLLGFEPKTSLEDGLARLVRWRRDVGPQVV